MKKSYFVILLLLGLLSVTSLKSQNDCFQYVRLSEGIENAIEDYEESHYVRGMLGLKYQHNSSDSVVFTLSSDFGVYTFLRSPTRYYSFCKGRMILIYNGEERDYNPNTDYIESFVYFLSNFDNIKPVIKCDWEKKELTLQRDNNFIMLYDPPTIQYNISNEQIIRRHELNGDDFYQIDYYPEHRYDIDIIFE